MREELFQLKLKSYEACYFKKDYDTKARFCSYWHQLNEIFKNNPANILEIGTGNGFISQYLKTRNFKLVTMDIKPELGPHVVGCVENLPFSENSFETVLCCEVLEHLPYQSFRHSLKCLARASRRSVIISLPDVTTVYRFFLELPRLKKIKIMLPHPFPKKSLHVYNGEHYWEIGKKNYSLRRISADIESSGLKIKNSYRVFEWPYHRFFVLTKDSHL
jgi:2-polyprenyl-3-methyl-5-hydroxy-6-metoxy-1,4-benzoquinol methylase